MPFANTVIERGIKGAKFYEVGTFASSGGSTGGTITPEYSGHGLSAGIREIDVADVSSDTNGGINKTYSNGKKTLTILTGANDTGTYYLEGYGA